MCERDEHTQHNNGQNRRDNEQPDVNYEPEPQGDQPQTDLWQQVSVNRERQMPPLQRCPQGDDLYEAPSEDNRSQEEPMHRNDDNAMSEMFQVMLQENRRRDEIMMKLIDRLAPQRPPQQSDDSEQDVRVCNQQNVNVMPEVLRRLPTFNGEKCNAKSFLDALDSAKILHALPDSYMLETARTRLIDGAKFWYQTYGSHIKTWQDFVARFQTTFVQKESVVVQWKKMSQRVQGKDESIDQYFHEKVKLCVDLQLEFDDIKQQILIGLWAKDLSDAMLAKTHFSIDHLLGDLHSYLTVEALRRERIRTNSNRPILHQHSTAGPKTTNASPKGPASVPFVPKVESKSPGLGNDKKYLPSRDAQGKPLCFTCKKYGHVSKYCRNNKKSPDAPETESTNTVDNLTIVDSVSAHDYKIDNLKYYHDAQINDKPVKCYVDLGSQCMLLKESVAHQLNLAPFARSNITIRGYGKGKITPIGHIVAVVKIDQASALTEIHIVPDESQNIPFIVGHPFTEQKHITIVKRANVLRLFEDTNTVDENDDTLMNMDIPELPSLKISLWAKEASIIPNNFVGFINVYGSEKIDQDLYIEKNTKYEKSIPRCVIRLDENAESCIPVMNISGQDIIVNEGERVTRAIPCAGERSIDVGKIDICERTTITKIKREDINVNDKLPIHTRERLYELLSEYEDCFATNLKELGITTNMKCTIQTTTDEPITYRPYRLSHAERVKVQGMVEELKQAGIIVDSNSPYASPVLIVKKKTGDERFCVDYRGLNKVTTKMEYPLPVINDQLERLAGKSYFTTLDMKSGYYQVPMDPSSQHKTAFVTCDGLYEFTKMPFGIVNGPAIFSRVINQVLGPLRFSIALAYMDDILLPSATDDEGIENLREILNVLRRANLKLNLKKCFFLEQSVEYLGFQISCGTIMPGTRKLRGVMNFPRPNNVRSVRQFLGLTGYFRRFIKNYAHKAKPLTNCLLKNSRWEWSPAQEHAFNELKTDLVQDNVLRLYDPQRETEVHTDASLVGLGGILLQRHDDGKLHPVAFVSRQTTKDEQKYHSTELETLCVTWTLEKLRVYLIGIEFKVVTDCNALRTAFSKKNLVPRIGRWWLKLQEFRFEVVHKPGVNMGHVDALSRNPNIETEETDIIQGLDMLYTEIDESDWLCLLQKCDPQIQAIIQKLHEEAVLEERQRHHSKEYEIRDGRLFRKMNEKLLWVVPHRIRWKILKKCHDDMGHPALDKTVHTILSKYWFPRVRNYAKGYIGSCPDCLYHKTPGGKSPGKLHSVEKIGIPFHTVHLDHLGPFVTSAGRRNAFLLVMIDGFTKFVFLKAVKSTKSIVTSRAFSEIIGITGPPLRVITDRGTAFSGSSFRKLCEERKIIHVMNATATPRANGQCERLNRFITPALATLCKNDDGIDWDRHIERLQYAINNTVHRTTGYTPFSLLFNFEPRNFDGNPIDDQLRKEMNQLEDIDLKRLQAMERIKTDQEKQRLRYNQHRSEAPNYLPGDLVLVRSCPAATGSSRKLLPKYKGPYVITQVLPNDRYRIEDLPETQRTQKFFKGVAAVDSLKKYHVEPPEHSETNDEEEEPEKDTPLQITSEKEDLVPSILPDVVLRSRRRQKPKYLDEYELFED